MSEEAKAIMRNNFLEKWYTKYDGEASPRHFKKMIKNRHATGLEPTTI